MRQLARRTAVSLIYDWIVVGSGRAEVKDEHVGSRTTIIIS